MAFDVLKSTCAEYSEHSYTFQSFCSPCWVLLWSSSFVTLQLSDIILWQQGMSSISTDSTTLHTNTYTNLIDPKYLKTNDGSRANSFSHKESCIKACSLSNTVTLIWVLSGQGKTTGGSLPTHISGSWILKILKDLVKSQMMVNTVLTSHLWKKQCLHCTSLTDLSNCASTLISVLYCYVLGMGICSYSSTYLFKTLQWSVLFFIHLW